MKKIELPSVGEILKEEFMEPNHISAYFLANAIEVPVSRIQDILHDRRAITIDTSIRLGRFFGLSDTYFLNIQNDIDARQILSKNKESFDRITPFHLSTVN